jgi:hypothetical protein
VKRAIDGQAPASWLRPGKGQCVLVVIGIEFSSGFVMTASYRLKMFMLSIVRSLRGKSNVVIGRDESESKVFPLPTKLRRGKFAVIAGIFG